MATKMQQGTVWDVVRRQYGVITRVQLLALGYGNAAVRHRLDDGRLHRVYPGVYAVGRPELSEYGSFMAAVLSAGPGAALSHDSGGALWRVVRRSGRSPIHVSTPRSRRGHEGVVVHRRTELKATRHNGIPVTTPAETLVDLAGCIERDELETAINEADYLGLVTPAQIRGALDDTTKRPGVGVLRALLDRATFALTQTQLERLLVPIARRAGLGKPLTQVRVNGHKVDFYFPELGLVVEADGGRAHRTPMQQTSDRRRDHAHFVAELTPLRFTHAQIAFEPEYVERVLRAAVERLSRAPAAA